MSSFPELRNAIFHSLEGPLAALGFTFNRSAQWFVRPSGNGRSDAYHLLINDSAPFVRVDVHLSTRIDAVEKIFHRTSGYMKQYQSQTPTMGGALDAITGNPEFKMLLDGRTGPRRARELLFSPAMISFYEEWYGRFSRLKGIDEELNDAPCSESPNRPLPWLRCSTGIIVAHLLSRPDYDRLSDIYSMMMQRLNDGFYWPRFESLLHDLGPVSPPLAGAEPDREA